MALRRRGLGVCVVVCCLAATGPLAVQAQPGAGPSDVCLEVASEHLPDDAWAAIVAAVGEAVAERPDLFPDPSIVERDGPETRRIDIHASSAGADPAGDVSGCLRDGSEWSIEVGRAFLAVGADRMLELAPTTPGIASEVEVTWFPDEDRLTTTLTFSGPFDVPNGTCWIDDRLSVDPDAGSATSVVEHGVRTSLFAESACGRFFDHLDKGGAGQQAITLLPADVPLAGGGGLSFVARDVDVEDDAVLLSGVLRSY